MHLQQKLIVMKRKIKKLLREYNNGGVLKLLEILTENEYFPKWLIHFSSSSLYKLAEFNEKVILKQKDGYEFSKGDVGDVDDIILLQNEEHDTTTSENENSKLHLVDFINNGNNLYLIKKEKILVAFLTVYRNEYLSTRNSYRSINYKFLLDENDIFFGYGYIAKEYRLRGLFPYLLHYALKNENAKNVFTEIDILNIGSIKSHERIGFNKIATLKVARLALPVLRWKLSYVSRESRINYKYVLSSPPACKIS